MHFSIFSNLLVASCEVNPTDLPELIHLTPDSAVIARDGRAFDFTYLSDIVEKTKLPLLLDLDHQSEHSEGSTAAAGWVVELLMNPPELAPGLWGRVDWTSLGRSLISDKTYRFISPTFLMDNSTKQVIKLLSVALTNKPALELTPVDYQRLAARFELKDNMPTVDEQIVQLCSALGVDPSADADQLSLAVQSATELKTQCVQLAAEIEKYKVTCSDLNSKIQELESTKFKTEVDQTLSSAAKEGKITPAQLNKFKEFCSVSPTNFELFKSNILNELKPVLAEVKINTSVEPEIPEHLKNTGLSDNEIKQALNYIESQKGKGK